MKKLHKLILVAVTMLMTFSVSASTFNDARVYINPGHGGWTANDRPLATINYEVMDTLGFFETNTLLIKCLDLYYNLVDAGVGFTKLSRNSNGWVIEDYYVATDNDKVTYEGEGEALVTLSVIAADVEANNIDYFFSAHSNAATEGTTTNYPLLLFRGYDAEVGNGLVEAKNMAVAAWPYINKNDCTYKSYYQNEGDCNARGDISFMGSYSTVNGYTGYYGVLKHGADGFLCEGCFHTYQPERHRLLNDDYCKQEGERFARAIRAWFGDAGKTTGDIMGTVKDISCALEHDLYNYKTNSIDAYYPLNGVTVTLKDKSGNILSTYTTDGEYNGVFVFPELTPGTYVIDYSSVEGFWEESEEIEVVANETSFTNATLIPLTEDPEDYVEGVVVEVTNYPYPEQDGDIVVSKSYNMAQAGEVKTIAELADVTIRRAILRDGYIYTLSVDADGTPSLMVFSAEDGTKVTDISTEGVSTEGYEGKSHKQIISDIAFTDDGVLIGTNSSVVGRESNSYQTGDFYVYKWEPIEGDDIAFAAPVTLYQLPTNTSNSIAAAGNNYSNYLANTIAVNGPSDNFNLYIDSHAGNGWTTTYGMKFGTWTFVNEEFTAYEWDSLSGIYESTVGEDFRLTLSANDIERLVYDSKSIATSEVYVQQGGTALSMPSMSDVSTLSSGGIFFRYGGSILFAMPIVTENEGKYDYSVNLYNVTEEGIGAAELINTSEVLATKDELLKTTAMVAVDNADINEYLMIGNEIYTYSTVDQAQVNGAIRVFAYDLKQEVNDDIFTLSYKLNADAETATIIFKNAESGAEVATVAGTANKGENSVVVDENTFDDITISYSWEVAVEGASITRFAKYSDDTDDMMKYYAPYGVKIDKSPESDYFGRVYVANTYAGTVDEKATEVGVYVLGADLSDVTEQGATAYTGGVEWTGTAGEGPRKMAVAADGRLFLCDQSTTNSGIYYMNPETMEASLFFDGATRSSGSLSVNGTYVCGEINSLGIRGEGESTELYAVDETASGSGWKKYVSVYNIGTATSWTQAPNSSKAHSSYIGNGNNSIQPVSGGFWAGQYRGAGSNSSANPSFFYYSDQYGDAVWDSATPSIVSESSQNGALAVNESETLIATCIGGQLEVYSYRLKLDATPEVTMEFAAALDGQSSYANDFEFDYAGNLYAVSNLGERLGVWAMPTTNNACTTPAKSTMLIIFASSVGDIESDAIVAVTPNPATSIVTITGKDMKDIKIYAANGAVVKSVAANNASSVTINVADLNAGIYLVKVDNEESVKLIKR
ncbi:MAG: T9SS type A sorting domain-containing protein [Bacteroidales bacterium]